MKQTIIGSIVRSKKEHEFIKGPIIALTRDQTKSIVEHLKKVQKWSTEYLDNNALLLESKFVSNLIGEIYLDEDYDNYFQLYGIDDFFHSNEVGFNLGLIRLTNNYRRIEVTCLGKMMTDKIVNLFPVVNFLEGLEITKENYYQFFQDKWISAFYDFDFSKSLYFVKIIDLDKYIIDSYESWWGLNDSTFLPLNYINY